MNAILSDAQKIDWFDVCNPVHVLCLYHYWQAGIDLGAGNYASRKLAIDARQSALIDQSQDDGMDLEEVNEVWGQLCRHYLPSIWR